MKTYEEVTANGFYWYDRGDQFNELNTMFGVVEVIEGHAYSPGISRGIKLSQCEGLFFGPITLERDDKPAEGFEFAAGMFVGFILGVLMTALFVGLPGVF